MIPFCILCMAELRTLVLLWYDAVRINNKRLNSSMFSHVFPCMYQIYPTFAADTVWLTQSISSWLKVFWLTIWWLHFIALDDLFSLFHLNRAFSNFDSIYAIICSVKNSWFGRLLSIELGSICCKVAKYTSIWNLSKTLRVRYHIPRLVNKHFEYWIFSDIFHEGFEHPRQKWSTRIRF